MKKITPKNYVLFVVQNNKAPLFTIEENGTFKLRGKKIAQDKEAAKLLLDSFKKIPKGTVFK
jgi:hypothetical protein